MNIIFKQDNKEYFEELWNRFLKDNNVDFQYSLNMIDYYLSSCKNLLDDKSFVLEHDKKCVGICFLPVEDNFNTITISISSGYVIAPLAINAKYEKITFNTINELSKNLNISYIKFKMSIFENNEFNKLKMYNFLDTSNSTCKINLFSKQEVLWLNLRKSYKSLINYLIKDDKYTLVYSDSSNINELHKNYVLFHKIHMENAGKIVKSDMLYDKQLGLCKNNLATIIAVQYKNKIIMTNYFFHDKLNVVYASSAYDTDHFFTKLAINHYLLWNAILYFKKLNFTTLGFGQPCNISPVDGIDDYASKKELSISNFKRGMGAEMIFNLQGIRFFNNTQLIKLITKFQKELETTI